jgi:hypothetical protein
MAAARGFTSTVRESTPNDASEPDPRVSDTVWSAVSPRRPSRSVLGNSGACDGTRGARRAWSDPGVSLAACRVRHQMFPTSGTNRWTRTWVSAYTEAIYSASASGGEASVEGFEGLAEGLGGGRGRGWTFGVWSWRWWLVL